MAICPRSICLKAIGVPGDHPLLHKTNAGKGNKPLRDGPKKLNEKAALP